LIIPTEEEIDQYLYELRTTIESEDCVFNISKTDKNDEFMDEYPMRINMIKQLIIDLTCGDFSEILINNHNHHKNEKLYLFGPIVDLTNILGQTRRVQIYLKINYLRNNKQVIVVSLHEARYKINFMF